MSRQGIFATDAFPEFHGVDLSSLYSGFTREGVGFSPRTPAGTHSLLPRGLSGLMGIDADDNALPRHDSNVDMLPRGLSQLLEQTLSVGNSPTAAGAAAMSTQNGNQNTNTMQRGLSRVFPDFSAAMNPPGVNGMRQYTPDAPEQSPTAEKTQSAAFPSNPVSSGSHTASISGLKGRISKRSNNSGGSKNVAFVKEETIGLENYDEDEDDREDGDDGDFENDGSGQKSGGKFTAEERRRRRAESNRLSAERSRERRKNYVKGLEYGIKNLQAENAQLKKAVALYQNQVAVLTDIVRLNGTTEQILAMDAVNQKLREQYK
mmetsp:Transcript_1927/g.3427  ORF Transcript_1927/g.3427 Transcript_1927/m.3427 type:complete len:319 (-) Transcript_1927:912-1868(-)|eukprot:CAMPEP_0182443094 /NCGR_PEP_ID=MMETSP1172-20130603/1922_1 /TAXON_ID=708627 /ORGANISM="Timspurckia oligopyrenoides, Strain CCMP3278" /LENGTH=318 /DNA_ID=CAMNT_0024638261 /DNA_START=235 /DNA_END=1191 /DNA_ORIENTATION=-